MNTTRTYIRFTKPELVLLFVAFLEKEGWKVDSNLKWKRDELTSALSSFPAGSTLGFNLRYKTVCRFKDDDDGKYVKTVSSLADFSTVLDDLTIKVGEYIPEFKPDGVQVGCTFVPWETVKAIAAKAP